MTSLSENGNRISDSEHCSVPVIGESLQHVARLKFEVLDQPQVSMKAESGNAPKPDVLELEREVIGLREQLLLQIDQSSSHNEQIRSSEVTALRLNWQKELEMRIRDERETILKTVLGFRVERDRYFGEVEAEVVKLALAIAARILHREANLDPLLLSGVVRVVLDKVSDGSAITLRVSLNDLESWRSCDEISKHACLQLVGDERLMAGDCVLDTEIGRVELGVPAQLQQIEQGFFDLLQQRPA